MASLAGVFSRLATTGSLARRGLSALRRTRKFATIETRAMHGFARANSKLGALRATLRGWKGMPRGIRAYRYQNYRAGVGRVARRNARVDRILGQASTRRRQLKTTFGRARRTGLGVVGLGGAGYVAGKHREKRQMTRGLRQYR